MNWYPVHSVWLYVIRGGYVEPECQLAVRRYLLLIAEAKAPEAEYDDKNDNQPCAVTLTENSTNAAHAHYLL